MGVALGIVAALSLSATAFAGEVKFGLAEALTGPIAKYGVPIRNGFALAAEQINAAGGVNGDTIALVVEDEQGKKEEALNVFKKLIFQDRVLALFGPTLSNSAFAADPIANQAKVVVFATSNTANGITDMGPWTFRNSIMEADVLPEVIRQAAAKFGIRKVAVLYGNDDAFTKGGYEVFKAALEAQKIPITGTETFAKGDVDFRAQLTKIKAQAPDAIVCSALAEEAANIILQARNLGIAVPFVGGNGFNSAKLFEIARSAADNTVMGGPWAAESDTPQNKAFVAAYTRKYGAEPDQFAAQGYDALHIVAAALKTIKLSGNLERDRQALRDALPLVKFSGATGPFAFRRAPAKPGVETGYDAQQSAHVFIARGGAFVLMK
jgi:branched-chain amino acid transport system substrate-binding protein